MDSWMRANPGRVVTQYQIPTELAEPEVPTEPETAANDRRMSVIIRTPKTQGNRKVTVTDISPLPTLCVTAGPTKVTKRRTSKAAILTGSPYKRQLEEDQNQKNKTAKKAKKPESISLRMPQYIVCVLQLLANNSEVDKEVCKLLSIFMFLL